jgi:very-short-patch-repair endonuclease
VRQLGIGPYIVDFACREGMLVIEVDGDTHGSQSEQRHDERRTAFLKSQGFRVLRFWNGDVYEALPDVCDAILAALGALKSPAASSRAT